MRLQGTNDTSRGRLEIYRSVYGWCSVYNHYWDRADAQVACREMGFNGARATYDYYYRIENKIDVLHFHPYCSGREASLRDCWRSPSMWRVSIPFSSVGIHCY